REGKLRALGVASAGRNVLAPELPTLIEGGVPDFVALTFTGVMAPAGTSASIVDKLNAAINESLRPPEVVAALGKPGAAVAPRCERDRPPSSPPSSPRSAISGATSSPAPASRRSEDQACPGRARR